MTLAGSAVAGIHHCFGDVLLLCGWTGGAVQAYRDAILAAPARAESHFRLGEALARRGRWREASAAFWEAARLAPTNAETYGNLALSLNRCGCFAAAVTALRSLIRLRPYEPELHLLCGALLLRSGRRSEAIAALRWAARLPATPATSRFFLGEALLGTRRWLEVAASLRAARAAVLRGPAAGFALCGGRLNRPPLPLVLAPRPLSQPQRSVAGVALPALLRQLRRISSRAWAALIRATRQGVAGTHVLIGVTLSSRSPHRAIRSLRHGVGLRTA